MEANCNYIPYNNTGFFTHIVIDYLNEAEKLQPFYQYKTNINGIYKAIEDRQQISYNRTALVEGLKDQYKNLPSSEKVNANIEMLLLPNTYTITTAHQANIFNGPVFSIYKIFHAIKTTEELAKQLPAYNFVPVFFVGSEDADLEELNNITVEGKKYVWPTSQTGAVGRMKSDKALQQLLMEMEGQLSVLPFGNELMQLFRETYKEGISLQQATLQLVNALFADYGLVVIIPDNKIFKQIFLPVIKKELTEQFSHKAVNRSIGRLEKDYKVQAAGRDINLFYLKDDKRERIEIHRADNRTKFKIQNLDIEFLNEEIIKEADEHPENFSPNVILRGMMQEMILPNLIYIGGGGELAYWLELKDVFAAAGVPYPMLLLRNSFLWIENKWMDKAVKLGLQPEDLFADEHTLMKKIVQRQSDNQVMLNGQLKKAEEVYDEILKQATAIDASLNNHVVALKTRSIKELIELEKKMVRAEKKKFETEQQHLQKLKSALFPNNGLQERVENFSSFYAKYGREWMQVIYQSSQTFGQQFGVINT